LGDVGLTRLKLVLNKGTLEERNMNYLAPELLVEAEDMQDKSISDLKKADIYSLGLTILGLMIGTLKITQDMKTFMSLGQEMNMTVF
jgi:hypothetical protein